VTAPATAREGFRLDADRSSLRALLRDLWGSRDLMRMLARKDFYVKYRRASFGMLWVIGLPMIQAAVMAYVFSHVVRIPVEGNYGVFVLSGILPWTFFSSTLTTASTSIVDGQALATKIYFPRAVFPLVSILSGVYGFVAGLGVLVVAALVLGTHLGPELVLLVPATVLMLTLCAGFSLVLAALHVYFRDIRFLVGAALMVWFYASPVLYPVSLAPQGLRLILQLNPASGMLILFRASLFGGLEGAGPAIISSVVWTVCLLALAAALHVRRDRLFVDLL
jgi:ABC-type polysaccharide/polyol phosphate export permease